MSLFIKQLYYEGRYGMPHANMMKSRVIELCGWEDVSV